MGTDPTFANHERWGRMPPDWREALAPTLAGPKMASLHEFLAAEARAGQIVFPAESDWFAALELTPLAAVRVVILGQDPYHGDGQAHGLSFSVRAGVRTPPSLGNIFKELTSDLGIARASHGDLTHWARQGVLLLNTVLTVRSAAAASHAGRGWEALTDAIIALIGAKSDPTVFLLWGAHARTKAALIDHSAHLVLAAPHPSPLSARTGFLGCRHFSQANDFLVDHGRRPIDWALPPGALSYP